MKLTKYEHACVVLEDQNQALVIDPGIFSHALDTTRTDVAAIVITHAHSDHIDPTKLTEIMARNQSVRIYAPREVADGFPNIPIIPMAAGEQVRTGPFTLAFSGGKHATIYESMPPLENLSVLINNTVYYPGDSFEPARWEIPVLLVPANAPWMKVSEAMDFIDRARSKRVIPTHDALLSEEGIQIYDNLLKNAADQAGGTYTRMRPGDHLFV